LLQELHRLILVRRVRALPILRTVTVVRDPEDLAAPEDCGPAGLLRPCAWCLCRVAHCSSLLMRRYRPVRLRRYRSMPRLLNRRGRRRRTTNASAGECLNSHTFGTT